MARLEAAQSETGWWVAATVMLVLFLGKYGWDQHTSQVAYDTWQRLGERAPAPPAVSGVPLAAPPREPPPRDAHVR